MSQIRGSVVPLPAADPLAAAIAGLVAGFTIETTPGAAAKIGDYREHLRPGAVVAVTFLPGSALGETVATAVRLRREGFEPMPHLAARSIASRADLDDALARLAGEAGATRAMVLAGAVARPLGPYASSMDLLETGLLDRHGIRHIGLAGHPEGSPDIPDAALAEALAWKNAFADRTDADCELVTQFVFDAAPVLAWEARIRAAGNRLPIRVGLPGLATVKTLIGHARACGIGPSMHVLLRRARSLAKLMSVAAPDALAADLARHRLAHPDSLIRGVHLYPLGGLRRSAAWSYAVADGALALDLDGPGFAVTRQID